MMNVEFLSDRIYKCPEINGIGVEGICFVIGWALAFGLLWARASGRL